MQEIIPTKRCGLLISKELLENVDEELSEKILVKYFKEYVEEVGKQDIYLTFGIKSSEIND